MMTKSKGVSVETTLSADRGGVTAIEYAMLGSIISIVIIAGLTLIGTDVTDTFQTLADAL